MPTPTMSDPTTEPKRRELRYPRSFLVLLLAGFVIVALPLILGLDRKSVV